MGVRLAMQGPHAKAAPQLPPEEAFALMLETACEQFEVLQLLVRRDIELSFAREPNDNRERLTFARATACIRMALAKSFIAYVVRARRICEHGSRYLKHVERLERTRFCKTTEGVLGVRDVNEHGFDVNADPDTRPQLHHQHDALLDETALTIFGADKILVGPLNLCNVYPAVARMREFAGFIALHQSKASAPLPPMGAPGQ